MLLAKVCLPIGGFLVLAWILIDGITFFPWLMGREVHDLVIVVVGQQLDGDGEGIDHSRAPVPDAHHVSCHWEWLLDTSLACTRANGGHQVQIDTCAQRPKRQFVNRAA